MRMFSAAGLTLAITTVAFASPGPQPHPVAASIPAARDVPYPGTMKIAVDTTDTARRIYKIREEIPVTAGDVTLLYPRWIPGAHAPVGTIDRLAGLTITANGKRLPWSRDVNDVFAFHVTAPAGTLIVEYQYLSPVSRTVGATEVGRELLVLDWPNVTLYPAGYFARQIPIQASVRVPDGWSIATALEQATPGSFKVVPVETLLDSPVHAGRHYKRYDVTPPGDKTSVSLDVMADRAEVTQLKPFVVDMTRKLVQQAYHLFGAKHYDHYNFLYALSDEISPDTTIEHHRSAEYVDASDIFDDWEHTAADRDLLAHEYVHSWDGKFRRPADLWTADYNTAPMRNSLLWVYEGGTSYFGHILTGRAGLWTKDQALDQFALTVARMQAAAGRDWRPLQDTTNDEIINPRRPMSWQSLQRFEDYYLEGELIWLDADTLIREKTGNKKSLDDFARAFFGGHDRDYTPITYQFDDVIKALNGVYAYDWATFLRTRLDQLGKVPLDGITRGGYKLEFTAEPSDLIKSAESRFKLTDHSYSLGIILDKDAGISYVAWGSPAAKAGVIAGMKLLAVDGLQYEPGRLARAIAAKKPLDLIFVSGEVYATKKLDYRGGLRYPHLVRDASRAALLDDILAPRP